MKRSRFLVGAGCCFAGFVLADGLTVPRSSFHMAVIDRLVDERQHMLRFFDGFVSSLNLQRRIPNVIVEEMVEEIVDLADDNITVADRSACQFSGSHDAVPSKFAAGLDDYRGSGYTRGHLAAAGNFRNREQQVMCDTFILGSNIVPQEARNNEDFWFRMEVYVLSGPVFLPHKVEDDPDKGLSRFRRGGPKQYLNHEVVGNVSVPTHLFKVYISIPNDNSPPLFSAFVVPNRPIKNKKLSEFQMSREDLERAVGFEILPNDKSVVSLCERVGGTNGCDELLMSDSQYKTYMVKVIGMCSGFFQENFKVFRRLGWAKNATELEAVMEKAKKKHVVIDEASRDLYEKKKAKFASRV